MGQPLLHFEIGCRDITKTADFFIRLFGRPAQNMGAAAMINCGSDGVQGHISSRGHESYHYTDVLRSGR